MTDEAPRQRRKLSAILMADVSGFSRMMGRDEEGTTAKIRDFHRRVLGHVEEHEGRVVDTAGDSVFGEFDSVVQAVRCAQAVQEDQARVNRDRGEDRIDTRIGVHLGDVIVEERNVYGDGVNIAARLESLADPGGIFVSEAVHQQVHNKLELPFEDLGVRELKNIEHPLRVFRVAPEALGNPPRVEVRGASLPAPRVQDPQSARKRRGQQRSGGPRKRRRRRPVGSWAEELTRPGALGQWVPGLGLLLSPVFFSTAGVFPTGGAVLLATSIGRAWNLKSGSRWNLLIALGVALVLGAVFTRWSDLTDGLFTLGGLLLVTLGVTNNMADARRKVG